MPSDHDKHSEAQTPEQQKDASANSKPSPTTPPPKTLTLWQHIWNGRWGLSGWLIIGGIFIFILTLAACPFFIK